MEIMVVMAKIQCVRKTQSFYY